MIGSGEDFDSNPIIVRLGVGEMSKGVNISVNCDKEVEGEERFEMRLSLLSNNPQVIAGRSRSSGRITDSTG